MEAFQKFFLWANSDKSPSGIESRRADEVTAGNLKFVRTEKGGIWVEQRDGSEDGFGVDIATAKQMAIKAISR